MDLSNHHNIDTAIDQFNQIILRNAQEYVPIHLDPIQHRLENHPLFSSLTQLRNKLKNKLRRVRSNLKKFRNNYQLHRQQQQLQSVKSSLHQVQQQLKTVHQQAQPKPKRVHNPNARYTRDINNAITNDTNTNIRYYWKCWNYLRQHKHSGVAPLRSGNTTYTSTKSKLSLFESQFKYAPPTPSLQYATVHQ